MQTYDSTKPEDGVTTFADLYDIILNHFETLRSGFSGTGFPTSPTPVAGQRCFRTDLGLTYEYNGSAWKEVGLEGVSFLAEIANSRGTKSTMDQRLDMALNEDGTLKASTSLNPSQWHTPSLTFVYVNTTTFTASGNQTDIYKATRRLKINLTASVAYSEVVSATYNSGPDTTSVVIYDAVLDNTLVSVEHSLYLPIRDQGAMSLEMVSGQRIVTKTGTYTTTLNDSVILCNGTFTVNLLASASAYYLGRGRPLLLVNIGSGTVTADGNASETINGSLTVALGPGQSLFIFPDGTGWKRGDQPTITPPAWTNITLTGWTVYTQPAYYKTPDNIVRMQGQFHSSSIARSNPIFTFGAGYLPSQDLTFHAGHYASTPLDITIFSSGEVSASQVGAGTDWWYSLDGVSFRASS